MQMLTGAMSWLTAVVMEASLKSNRISPIRAVLIALALGAGFAGAAAAADTGVPLQGTLNAGNAELAVGSKAGTGKFFYVHKERPMLDGAVGGSGSRPHPAGWRAGRAVDAGGLAE
jgi:hypothetical protein